MDWFCSIAVFTRVNGLRVELHPLGHGETSKEREAEDEEVS